jgi:hypothetical protein
MTTEHQQSKRNRKAVISLIAGILSLLYCLLFVIDFWVSLSVFSTDILISALPIFVLGCLAIAWGYLSLRKISLSHGILKGKVNSILGIVLGFLSFALLLLPRASFIVYSVTHPPNYEVVLQLQERPTPKITSSILRHTEGVVSARLRDLAVPYKTDTVTPDKIIVRLRVLDTFKEDNLTNLFRSGLLSFHLVHQDNENIARQSSAPGFTAPQGFKSVISGNENLFVRSEAELVDNVDDAKVQIDEASHYYIAIQFRPEGTERLSRITRENIGRRLAIMVDEAIYSAPVIREPITEGRARITGNFTVEEARDFAIVLRSGAIPVPIRVIEGHFLKR